MMTYKQLIEALKQHNPDSNLLVGEDRVPYNIVKTKDSISIETRSVLDEDYDDYESRVADDHSPMKELELYANWTVAEMIALLEQLPEDATADFGSQIGKQYATEVKNMGDSVHIFYKAMGRRADKQCEKCRVEK